MNPFDNLDFGQPKPPLKKSRKKAQGIPTVVVPDCDLPEEVVSITKKITEIWEEGAKDPKTLLLGLSGTVRAGEVTGVAAPAGTGPVVIVDAKDVRDLSKSATDLRDKSVVGSFDMKDVKSLRVSVGGKRLVLERKGDADWRVLEPAKGAAKEFKVSGLLLALRGLRWKEIASADGADPARFGLDKPEIEIAVLKGDGGEVAGLAVGRADDKVAYVRSKLSPAIYAVDPKSLEDLRKAPTDIPG